MLLTRCGQRSIVAPDVEVRRLQNVVKREEILRANITGFGLSYSLSLVYVWSNDVEEFNSLYERNLRMEFSIFRVVKTSPRMSGSHGRGCPRLLVRLSPQELRWKFYTSSWSGRDELPRRKTLHSPYARISSGCGGHGKWNYWCQVGHRWCLIGFHRHRWTRGWSRDHRYCSWLLSGV